MGQTAIRFRAFTRVNATCYLHPHPLSSTFDLEGDRIMRHGHGTTSNSQKEQIRRRVQPARDMAKAEKNRRRSIGGGSPDERGVIQGQSGEQGETVNKRDAYNRGPVRH
jgi:hypothetical protein